MIRILVYSKWNIHTRGGCRSRSAVNDSVLSDIIAVHTQWDFYFYFCFAVDWMPIDTHTNFVGIHLSCISPVRHFTHWSHTVIFSLQAKSKQNKNTTTTATSAAATPKRKKNRYCCANICCRLSKRAQKNQLQIIERNKQNH